MDKEEQTQIENETQNQSPEAEKEVDEVDIEKYKDIEGISTKKLNFGLWITEHKKQFRMSLIIFLIVVAATSWAYTIYGFAYYFSRGMKEDEILVKDLLASNTIGHDYIVKISAQDLIYSSVNVLRTGSKYDFLTEIKNPNEKHWASFRYCFLIQGKEVDCSGGFILPKETKYLMSLAQEFEYQPTNIQFVVRDLKWQRINAHKYPDWQQFKDEHLNFEIKEVGFSPAESSGLSEKLSFNLLEFTTRNNTPYNYWEVVFNILLSRGSSIVGVNKYTVAEFMSGEEKFIQINWPDNLGRVNDIEIIPEINIIQDGIYIKYEGGIGEEK